jgi:3-isopropylmalate/(R)-2-methylmalate dehydratase small subunit
MAGWQTHQGRAIALPLANVDTDQLIPARFMSVPRSEGYGKYLLHDMRRTADGTLDPDFPLNGENDASVLLAGANFGIGSSREAAVYTLVDAGFRAVIAPSFGDIFSSNAVNNGLLPARVSAPDWEALNKAIGNAPTQIDLTAGTISVGTVHVSFALEDSWRVKLINGWDDIDLTKHRASEIAAYKEHRHQTASWAWPAPPD